MEQTTNNKKLFSKMTYQEKILFLDNLTPENKNLFSKITDTNEKVIFLEKISTEDEKTEDEKTEVITEDEKTEVEKTEVEKTEVITEVEKTEDEKKISVKMTNIEKADVLQKRRELLAKKSELLAKRQRQLLAPEIKKNRKKRSHRLIMLGFVLLESMGKTDLDAASIKIADDWDTKNKAKLKEKKANELQKSTNQTTSNDAKS